MSWHGEGTESQVFPIARGSSVTLWFIVGLLAFLAAVPLSLVVISSWPWSGRFLVSTAGLKIEGSTYGREFAMPVLRVSEARRLSALDTPGYWPAWRTNGIGLPSYQAGWFQLNNQRKALVFVTDWSRSVIVPTEEGFLLLLSPDDPDSFLDALRAAALAPARASSPDVPTQTFTFSARSPSGREIRLPVALTLLLPVMIGVPIGLLAWTCRRSLVRMVRTGTANPRTLWQAGSARGADCQGGSTSRPQDRPFIPRHDPDQRHRHAWLSRRLVPVQGGIQRPRVRDGSDTGRRCTDQPGLHVGAQSCRPGGVPVGSSEIATRPWPGKCLE